MIRGMGWLTKILKGSSSSHRISEGRYHDIYENEEIWEEPPSIEVVNIFLHVK